VQGKREQLVQARPRTLSEHHRFLLASQLRQLDFFDHQLLELDQEIAHRMGLSSGAQDPDGPPGVPTKEETSETPDSPGAAASTPPLAVPPLAKPLSSARALRILDEIPGVNERIGASIVAELGLEMDQFPDEAHLCSWVGLCPAAKISANKRLSTKTGKGNRGPRQALIEAANAAAREPRYLSECLLPTIAQAHGAQESAGGSGSSHPDQYLSLTQRTASVSGAGASAC
jgi:transposase